MNKMQAAALAAAISVIGAGAGAQSFDGVYAGGGLAYAQGEVGSETVVNHIVPDYKGMRGFVFAGYNRSAGAMTVGVEGDLSFGGVDGTARCFNPTWTCNSALRTTASLRGRVGTEAMGTLLYATAGVAAARVELSTVNSGGTAFPDSHTMFGWTAGIGAERALAGGWNLRGEYLYTDFNDTDFTNDVTYQNVGATVSAVRIGLSRKF